MSKNLGRTSSPASRGSPFRTKTKPSKKKSSGPSSPRTSGVWRGTAPPASRRGATAARGVGTAPSSIAGAFSAALETAKHAMESGWEHRRAVRDGGAPGQRVTAARRLETAPAGDDSETRAVRARAAVRAGQRVDALGRVVFIHKKAWKRRGYHGGARRRIRRRRSSLREIASRIVLASCLHSTCDGQECAARSTPLGPNRLASG